jgi:hypothetical protein
VKVRDRMSHSAERGELLGAFSYKLVREGVKE